MVPFMYFTMATLNYLLNFEKNKFKNKEEFLSGEKDFLLGVDRINLYLDSTFYIQYADHNYYGTYKLNKDTISLNIDRAILSPLRESFPDKLIIKGDLFFKLNTNEDLFKIYKTTPN